ncbi:MAG: hypothetical protein CL920_19480 [Deltaproteobacteria bacterium]|nr:hypothetical protein [Deltaproteobacteria bacterium]MBU50870.1 hypothetical protein [Deltaproteobacteria bacterium]
MSMRAVILCFLLCLSSALLFACPTPPGECTQTSDCPDDSTCVKNVCVSSTPSEEPAPDAEANVIDEPSAQPEPEPTPEPERPTPEEPSAQPEPEPTPEPDVEKEAPPEPDPRFRSCEKHQECPPLGDNSTGLCMRYDNAQTGHCTVPCQKDEECTTGFKCTQAQLDGASVSVCLQDKLKTCTEDTNCSPGTLCHVGRCLPMCLTNRDCQQGYACQAETNQCIRLHNKTCNAQSECLGYACGCAQDAQNNNQCCLLCTKPSDCSPGYTCDIARQRCVQLPAGKCTKTSTCPDGFACDALTQRCHTTCTQDAQCRGANICTAGKCAPPTGLKGCTQNADCSGSRCDVGALSASKNGVCLVSCNADSDCQSLLPGYRCQQSTSGGTCHTECTENTHCLAGYTCDTPSKKCVSLPSACLNEQGTCPTNDLKQTCTLHTQCPGHYRCHEALKVCHTTCTNNRQCQSGHYCTSRGLCNKLPASCTSNTECSGYRCVNNKCTTKCEKASDCNTLGNAYTCKDQACIPLGSDFCTSDIPCAFTKLSCNSESYTCNLGCSSHRDCIEENYCNTKSSNPTCTSLPFSPKCTTNAGCEGGFICSSGYCLLSCNDDEDCQDGYACDTDRKQCFYLGTTPTSGLPRKRCTKQAHCKNNARCLEQYKTCLPACAADTDCKQGFRCNNGAGGSNGGCIKRTAKTCTLDKDCDGGYACKGGDCMLQCLSTNDCKSDHICVEGHCIQSAPGACNKDTDCAGYRCDLVRQQCATTCFRPEDCRSGFNCQGATCKQASTSCVSNSECRGYRCVGGVCTTSCTQIGECSTGYTCDTNAKLCKAGCTINLECPYNQFCDSGQCKPISTKCSSGIGTKQCGGYACQNGYCRKNCIPKTQGACDKNYACDQTTQRCYKSPIANVCILDAHCPNGFACQKAQALLTQKCFTTCTTNTECQLGFHCKANKCIANLVSPGTQCTNDAACGSGGFACTLVNGIRQCRANCQKDSHCQPNYTCDTAEGKCR